MLAYRKPIYTKPRRKRVTRQASIPAPVGGWNKRDVISAMDETDAYDIENFFPKTSEVALRNGYLSFATGVGGTINTLMEYASPTAREFFAAGNSAIYDVTAGGAVGAAEVSSLTSTKFQHTMFATDAGNFLILCNGEDDVITYNGTAWDTTSGITGTTPDDFIHVCAYKFRLYFTPKEKLEVWYLGDKAISGAATRFNVAPLAKLGGYLVGMFGWTVDAGEGQDDYAVFLTSQGEVIVFSGLNPGDSAWSHKGTYNIGRPIGRRCAMKYGGDLMILTEDGYVFLSRVLPSSRGSDEYAASEKIQGAVLEATRSYKTEFGWQPILYPQGQYGLVNVPQGSGVFIQHIFNTETGAWTRFRNQNAFCWSLFNDNLYFGTAAGTVFKADIGSSDAGSNITAYVKPAFSYFKAPGLRKTWKAIRPIFNSGVQVKPSIQFNVDFKDSAVMAAASSNDTSGTALWDTALWDVATWPSDTSVTAQWQSLSNSGISGSATVAVATMTSTISLYSFDYVYEVGGTY